MRNRSTHRGADKRADRLRQSSRRLRIGIDASALCGPRSGIGRYIRELSEQLVRRHRDIEVHFFAPRPPTDWPSGTGIWHVDRPARLLGGPWWIRYRAPEIAAAIGVDAYWSNRTIAPHPYRRFPVLFTIYDLNPLLFPETMQRRTLDLFRLYFPADLCDCEHLSSISAGTAQRLRDRLGLTTDSIIRPAAGGLFAPTTESDRLVAMSSVGLDAPFICAVGTLEPRKNLSSLIAAFISLKQRGHLARWRLVIAGMQGWSDGALLSLVASAQEKGVCLLGFVPDEKLRALYASAELVVMPSLYEGYGIPIAEALACGARVLASDTPETREAGGSRATYCGTSAEHIADGILEALSFPRPAPWRGHGWADQADLLARALECTAVTGRRPPDRTIPELFPTMQRLAALPAMCPDIRHIRQRLVHLLTRGRRRKPPSSERFPAWHGVLPWRGGRVGERTPDA